MSQKRIKRRNKLIDTEILAKNKENIGDVSVKDIIRKNFGFLTLCTFGTILIYLNSLFGAFVSDDYATITQNRNILNFDLGSITGYPGLVKYLVAVMFGTSNPFPYHLSSLLNYLIVILLVFIFTRLYFSNRISRYCTLIFSVLPIHIEVVSWISGLPYLGNAIFVLLFLILFSIFLLNNDWKYFYWSIFIELLCIWAEPVRGLASIILLILILLIFSEKFKVKINYFKIVFGLVCLMIVGLILLWPRILFRIGVVNSGINFNNSIFYSPFEQYPASVSKYLQLLAFPTDLTLYHTMFVFPLWLSWSIILLYIVMLGYFFIKWKKGFFAMAFIFMATAPSMAPVKVSWIVAERYMFLGSIGFCIFLALIFEKIEKKFSIVAPILIGCIVIIYCIRIFYRNIDWQTNHNLWTSTCYVSPNSHNAWNNIGDDYDKVQDYKNAVKGFGMSFKIKPNYADAMHNQGNVFFKIGRLDLAKEDYMMSVKTNPRMHQSYMAWTQIELISGNYDTAYELSKKIVDLQPNNPQSWHIMGLAFQYKGDLENAKKAFTESYKLDSSYEPAVTSLKELEITK